MSMNRLDELKQFVRALVTRTLEFEFERMPYRLENVSRTKLLNLLRSMLNCARSHASEPAYPVQLQIEASSACTLHCPLCPSGAGSIDRPRKPMPLSMFETIMDEVGDHAIVAMLWIWGEPFTNPRLPEMISYARNKHVAVVISTNGQHVQEKDEAERLVASGLDNLIVALDGATQEAYSKFRVGGDVSRVFRCLQLIRQAKDSLGSENPRVNVRSVVTKDNEHELAEIENIARKCGANMVSRKAVSVLDYRKDRGLDAASMPSDIRKGFMRRSAETSSPGADWRCRRPWSRLTITAEGTVLPCEFDFCQSEAFGNGRDGSFIGTWRGRTAAEFRRRHLVDKRQFPFCADCRCGWVRTGKTTTISMKHITRDAVAAS